MGILSPADAKKQAARMKPAPQTDPGKGAFSMRFTDRAHRKSPGVLTEIPHLMAGSVYRLARAGGGSAEGVRSGVVVAEAVGLAVDHDPTVIHTHPGATYVACFSRDTDSLSQWRGYAGQPGYAVGLDRAQVQDQLLTPLIDTPGHEWESDLFIRPLVQPVQYGEAAARECLRPPSLDHRFCTQLRAGPCRDR